MSLKRQEMRNEATASFRRLCCAVAVVVQDESGVTSIEYALLGALIAIAALVGINTLGVELNALWTRVANAVVAAL